MDKKYVFFDLDGTIVDSSGGIFESIDYSLEKLGETPLSIEIKRKFVGPPLTVSYKKYLGFDEKKAIEAQEYFRENYRARGIYNHKLYEGVDTLIKSLYADGKTIVLATSKPEIHAKTIIKSYELDKYFTALCGATFDDKRVTKAQVLRYAIETVGMTDKKDGILIGDTSNDVIGANEVGIDCIGVLFGFGTKQELESAGAIATAKTATDVLNILI